MPRSRRGFFSGRAAQRHLAQGERIMRGVAVLIVVEINIDRSEAALPFMNPACPCGESGAGIAALILPRVRAMQPDVGKVSRDVARRVVPGELIDAEGGIEALENAIDRGGDPAQFAKLKGITAPAGQE